MLLYLLFSIFFLVIFGQVKCIDIESGVKVTIKQGTLEGLQSVSRNGSKYRSFYGIPYAKPPIDGLRFEPPQDPDHWDGIRSANQSAPYCVQQVSSRTVNKTYIGEEDCLYLNVFSPLEVTEGKKLAVVVYIHGGGNKIGNAEIYDPVYLMDHSVVVVVIQYRLDLFGFLSTASKEMPGNNGMKDQVKALKWIQMNIDAFGGDPKQVTIMGESSGGSSVHLHMYSNMSTGLFHRAISQSGTAFNSWLLKRPSIAKENARALATISGCSARSIPNMLTCLKKLPTAQLIYSSTKFYVWDKVPSITFSVVVEPPGVDGAFLTIDPWKNDVVNQVPWIVGVVKDEGSSYVAKYLLDKEKLKYIDENYQILLPIMLSYNEWLNEKNASALTSAIKKYYFNDDKISTDYDIKLIELFSDSGFICASIEAAKRYKGLTYFYMYSHRNSHSMNDVYGEYTKNLGVGHSDDLISFFNVPLFNIPKVTEGNDLVVSERVINYWINFIKTGDPNGNELLWKPLTANFEYLNITSDSDYMGEKLLQDKYNFWKPYLFYDDYNDNYDSYDLRPNSKAIKLTNSLFLIVAILLLVI